MFEAHRQSKRKDARRLILHSLDVVGLNKMERLRSGGFVVRKPEDIEASRFQFSLGNHLGRHVVGQNITLRNQTLCIHKARSIVTMHFWFGVTACTGMMAIRQIVEFPLGMNAHLALELAFPFACRCIFANAVH